MWMLLSVTYSLSSRMSQQGNGQVLNTARELLQTQKK